MGEALQEVVKRRPSSRLAPYVSSYTGYRFAGLEPGTHQGLPSRNLTFIVSLDGPIDIVSTPGSQSSVSFEAFVGGMQERPATVAHGGRGAGLSVALSPLGTRALLGVPAGPLAAQVVDLHDLIGSSAAHLLDRLGQARSWNERFALLDAELVRSLRPSPDVPVVVTQTWDRLVGSGGRVGIAALASELGWSRRHVAGAFKAELGISPKAGARVLRFERTCRLLDIGVPQARAAALSGYYDQSHMVAEWHALAGMSPSAWRRDDVRDRAGPADSPAQT